MAGINAISKTIKFLEENIEQFSGFMINKVFFNKMQKELTIKNR